MTGRFYFYGYVHSYRLGNMLGLMKALTVNTAMGLTFIGVILHKVPKCWVSLGDSEGSCPLCHAEVPSSLVQPLCSLCLPSTFSSTNARMIFTFSLLIPHPLDPSLLRPFPQPRSIQRWKGRRRRWLSCICQLLSPPLTWMRPFMVFSWANTDAFVLWACGTGWN